MKTQALEKLSDIKPGQLCMLTTFRPVSAINDVRFVHGDTTGLNREIGYFKYANRPHPEFAIWQHELDRGVCALSKIGKAQKDYRAFKNEFAALCFKFDGVFNAADTIGNGAAYHFATKFGVLRVSIHDDSGYGHRSTIQSVYLQFKKYTGPYPFPLAGDINRFSHKWNITMSAGDLASARRESLLELERRLESVRGQLPIVLPIADLYAALLAAVNRGDLPQAQQLAGQIAA